jgi:RNA polymerase sigma factor (sigma-70 family)
MSKDKTLSYSDCSEIIDNELHKRRGKWFLYSIAWLDFDDVCQIIRAHINKKWDQWDQERALEPWLNRIISNQLKNILRNNYGNFVRPCLNCPFNQSGPPDGVSEGLCGFTKSGAQCSECPLYHKWEKTKKDAYNTKMALTLENHQNEAQSLPEETFWEIDSSIDKIHFYMKKELGEKRYKIYKLLYIDYVDEEEVAEIMGYKTTEKGRSAGYKQMRNLKKFFKEKVEYVIENYDIITHGN